MKLKRFQEDAISVLTQYLERARLAGDPEQAFIEILREREPGNSPATYRTIAGLVGVPNVCLRLPTGGGKTLLASHTVATAGRHFLERDFPVVLWMVPTNTIRTQTAEALKKSSHPYRAALDEAFDSRVSVFDISEIAQIRPQDLTERVTVIVTAVACIGIRGGGELHNAGWFQGGQHFEGKVSTRLVCLVDDNKGAMKSHQIDE